MRLVKWQIIVRCTALLTLLGVAMFGLPSTAASFGFDEVVRIARDQSLLPFKETGKKVPEFLMDITYDQWRDIRFKTENSLWRSEDLQFEVQFFHPGLFYNHIVPIYVIDGAGVNPIAFDRRLFNYGKNTFVDNIPENFGFAGFRIHFPINKKDYHDEVAVFLGASYFRAVAKNQVYGLSARGLSVDTGEATGEEFPFFKCFWLVRPSAGAKSMSVFALLDSESLTGAYHFVITPGESTNMRVEVTLFARKSIKKLGIAPLTSMYFFSESTNQMPVDDFRPEVHDSDGLLLAYPSGEFVWRPLVNFEKLFINTFSLSESIGFGLLQRDVNFDHYQDLEARYEMRPSAWVDPIGEWGAGRVQVIQIPTDSEMNDNIVAFWSPEAILRAGETRTYRYDLKLFTAAHMPVHPLGYVVATRTETEGENKRKLIVDFSGGRLANLPTDLPAEEPLEAVINVQGKGEVIDKQIYRNEPGKGWRLVFVIRKIGQSTLGKVIPALETEPPIEIRAFLKQADQVLTETWSFAIRL